MQGYGGCGVWRCSGAGVRGVQGVRACGVAAGAKHLVPAHTADRGDLTLPLPLPLTLTLTLALALALALALTLTLSVTLTLTLTLTSAWWPRTLLTEVTTPWNQRLSPSHHTRSLVRASATARIRG